jgi:carboxyl-terminal processing protease
MHPLPFSRKPSSAIAALAAMLPLSLLLPSSAEQQQQPPQADYNEIGKQMAIMLENGHFAQLPFSQLNGRFLEHYLKTLDPGRIYFTAGDVARFQKDYGASLDRMLLQEESMQAAEKIYGVFRTRVAARVAEARRMLAEELPAFTGSEMVNLNRKDAPWPRDEAEAMDLLRQQVREALLEEILRRESAPASLAPAKKPAEDPGAERTPQEKLAARYDRLLHNATDPGPGEVAAFFLSAVAQSFDPHSDYMSGAELVRFYQEMRTETIGIGAWVQSEEDGATRIRGLTIHGPADREGELQPGDHLTGIDPDGPGPRELVDISFMRIDKVIELIRGEKGTPVTLRVEPGAGGPAVLETIMREEVPLIDQQASARVVELRQEGDRPLRLGILKLPSFYRDFENDRTSSATDVQRLLLRLKQEAIDGLLLDLRGNGGGAVSEVRRIAGFFIPPGPVVQVKDSIGHVEVLDTADKGPAMYDGLLVVLTDRGSASASEILAAALQDNNRAVIVGGESTFGKGTVQEIRDIGKQMPYFATRANAGGLKLTIQKFYRPSGLSTQHRGVVPDLRLPSLMDAWEQGEDGLDYPLAQDRIAPAPDFHPAEKDGLHLPELIARSAARVAASKDFAEIAAGAAKLKKQLLERNEVSLNLATRRREIARETALTKEREEERAVRSTATQADDAARMTFYALSLDDLATGKDLRRIDPSSPATVRSDMRLEPASPRHDGTAAPPPWPSGLEPRERESIAVLTDLISLSRGPAGSAEKSKELLRGH